jgi:hypothetical protein
MRLPRVALAVICVTGCASAPPLPSPQDYCLDDATRQWEFLADWPENRNGLLDLDSGGDPVRQQFGVASIGPRKEVWFQSGPDHLLMCRFEPIRDLCKSAVTTVAFERDTSGWKAGPVLSSICWQDYRIERTHNNALEQSAAGSFEKR